MIATAGLVAGVASAAAPFHCQSLNLAYLFAIPYLPAGLLAIDHCSYRKR
jgi:hypothetical protein